MNYIRDTRVTCERWTSYNERICAQCKSNHKMNTKSAISADYCHIHTHIHPEIILYL